MKLVRQCKDTFIRKFGDIGYITNQLTKHDRVYDDVGAVFLKQLSREPQSVSHIVDTLYPLFVGVDKKSLHQDFVEFIDDLEGDKFLVTGDSEHELDRNEPSFSYQAANPKTITFNFAQKDRGREYPDTTDFFYQYFKDSPTIFSLQMEVTARCNERCIHCYIPHVEKIGDMPLSLATSLMDQAAAMGTVSLSLSGGELFLHPRIEEILAHARRNDFMITILSNATKLDHELCHLLKEININFIQVSLYSMDANEHDAITQVDGSHAKTLQAIERLLELDIPVQISCPVMKHNLGSYREVLTWAYRHKIKAYTDFIMMARTDFSTDNLDQRLNLRETEALIQDIIEVDEMYTSILDQEPPSANLEDYADQPVCGVGVDNICVTADGQFYPCSGFQGYSLGDAHRQTLREVWESSERIRFLRGITNASFPQCMECEARDYCAMCLVRNFNESGGDMFRINEHFCKVAFINKRLVEEYRRNKQAQTA